MSEVREYRPDIAAVVDLAEQMDRDRARPETALRERDREVGLGLEGLRGAPLRQILAWLSRVSARQERTTGDRVAAAFRTFSLLLGAAGLVSGWLAASAVFYYDGARPVNVIHVVAVFVVAQAALVLLLLVTLFSRSFLSRLPGAGAVLGALDLLSPGRLRKLALRRLPESARRATESLLGASRAHRALFGRIETWGATASAQTFAFFFNGGALAGCLLLVLFSDLAFSWSTTLQATTGQVHAVTSLLSAPWRDTLPEAVPSQDLIEQSRYYRLGEGNLPRQDAQGGGGPESLGGWWPFLVMCMLFYGLLPRLVLWAFAAWRLRSALRHSLLHFPGVTDVLDRMNRELVETQARVAETVGPLPGRASPTAAAPPASRLPCTVVNWGEVPLEAESLSRSAAAILGCAPAEVLVAGGGGSLDRDREAVRKAGGADRGGGVVSFVRAWEPPLEELTDFLGELRESLREGAPVIVVPVGVGEGPSPPPPMPAQVETWAARLQALGDPWLTVRAAGGAPP